jgi:pyridoxine 5-phosphate synthase
MTKLSVNLNKVALVRNSRNTTIPSVVAAAVTCLAAGADGITVHPRPDQRHIRPDDARDLAKLLATDQYKEIEFNIEGNPYAGKEPNGYPGFMALVEETKPEQCTLVPDDPHQLTSDHGWDLTGESNQLQEIVTELQHQNIRVSLFMDPIAEQIELAARLGVERIELYTGPFADDYHDGQKRQAHLATFAEAARIAHSLGMGINAGHDLNLENLAAFCAHVIPVDEVSIGHAIITDSLWMGFESTIKQYCAILKTVNY